MIVNCRKERKNLYLKLTLRGLFRRGRHAFLFRVIPIPPLYSTDETFFSGGVMTPANGTEFFPLLCCVPLCAFPIALALVTILFLRRRGNAALPLLQLLFDRSDAQDDALDLGSSVAPTPNRPDLNAIARQYDFDEALQTQSGTTPPSIPGFESPTRTPPARSSSVWDSEERERDEDDEFGFSESDP